MIHCRKGMRKGFQFLWLWAGLVFSASFLTFKSFSTLLSNLYRLWKHLTLCSNGLQHLCLPSLLWLATLGRQINNVRNIHHKSLGNWGNLNSPAEFWYTLTTHTALGKAACNCKSLTWGASHTVLLRAWPSAADLRGVFSRVHGSRTECLNPPGKSSRLCFS